MNELLPRRALNAHNDLSRLAFHDPNLNWHTILLHLAAASFGRKNDTC
jgi:hypothetical protein